MDCLNTPMMLKSQKLALLEKLKEIQYPEMFRWVEKGE